jgi:hypothetical protein
MSISIGRIINFAALAAFVGTGLMQGAQQATFHLPVTAHWGKAVLEPGDYKMMLPAPSAGQREFLVQGPRQTVLELPLVTDVQNISSSSHLKLYEVNGDYFIRELSFGPEGKTFTFSVPKTSHRRLVANGDSSVLDIAGH